MIKRYIQVKFQKEGIHCFPAAASDKTFATGDNMDVSFLSHPHLHYFHFVVTLQVFHNDRDIEFIQFRRWCESLYNEKTLELDNQSCEMIAEKLIEEIQKKYGFERTIKAEVYEDNINGAILEYNWPP